MARYAIGDIHGFAEPLRVLLEQVELTQEDTLVFLGDYVDKGPDVAGVLEQLVCLSGRANTIFLRGNHDQLFLNAYQNLDAVSVWECLAGVIRNRCNNCKSSNTNNNIINNYIGKMPFWLVLGSFRPPQKPPKSRGNPFKSLLKPSGSPPRHKK